MMPMGNEFVSTLYRPRRISKPVSRGRVVGGVIANITRGRVGRYVHRLSGKPAGAMAGADWSRRLEPETDQPNGDCSQGLATSSYRQAGYSFRLSQD